MPEGALFLWENAEKRETGEMGWRGGIAGGGQSGNGEMAGRVEMVKGGQSGNGEMAERSFFGKKHSR